MSRLHGVVDGARRGLEPGDSSTLVRVHTADPAARGEGLAAGLSRRDPDPGAARTGAAGGQ
ncbi:hypothetical protein ACRAWD_24545 [Caulobacter segnis]